MIHSLTNTIRLCLICINIVVHMSSMTNANKPITAFISSPSLSSHVHKSSMISQSISSQFSTIRNENYLQNNKNVLGNKPMYMTSTKLSSTDGSDIPKEEKEKKELTLDMVIEMTEVTFVNACLQLSKGYVDVLKLFIVAVKTAYTMNTSIPSLLTKLENFPHQSANRPLMKEEIALRTTWINLIYMTLESLQIKKDVVATVDDDNDTELSTSSSSDEIHQTYKEYVTYITNWRRKQNEDERDALSIVSELKVDDVLENCSSSASSGLDTMTKAMLPQNIRVLLFTLVVLEEERLCLDDIEEGEIMPPAPPIPGTR